MTEAQILSAFIEAVRAGKSVTLRTACGDRKTGVASWDSHEDGMLPMLVKSPDDHKPCHFGVWRTDRLNSHVVFVEIDATNECGGELELADMQVVKLTRVGRVPVARRACKQCGREVVCSVTLTRCWQPAKE